MILGFIAALSFLVLMLIGFFFPRFYEPLIPVHRRSEGMEDTVVNELKQKDSIDERSTVEVVSPSSIVHSPTFRVVLVPSAGRHHADDKQVEAA